MDLISSSLVGGLIFNYTQMGLSTYLDIVKVALKDYVLSEDEQKLIALDLEKATKEDKSSQENLEKYFEEKAENTKEIVEKYKAKNLQVNTGGTSTQVNQENENGDNVAGNKVINNNYNGTQATKEELKKH